MSVISKLAMLGAAGAGGSAKGYYSRVDVSGSTVRFSVRGAALSSDGYVAIASKSSPAPYNALHSADVQVFDSDGNQTFWKYDGFNSGYDTTTAEDVAIDDAYVYVVHNYYDYPLNSNKDRVYMTCFDRDTGSIQWHRKYNDMRPNTNNSVGHKLINGASGELIMCGKYATSGGGTAGGYIARISKTDGSIVASKRTGDGLSWPSGCLGIKYDASNSNILFSLGYGIWSVNYALTAVNFCVQPGTASSGFDFGSTLCASVDLGNYGLLVMNLSGVRQWRLAINGSTYRPTDVCVDSDDNVYLVRQDGSTFDKYDSTGTHQWTRSWSPMTVGDEGTYVAVREMDGFLVRSRVNVGYDQKGGAIKFPTDGSGTGTFGDLTYATGTNPSFASDTGNPTTLTGVLGSDIGSSSTITSYPAWNNAIGTLTKTVYPFP